MRDVASLLSRVIGPFNQHCCGSGTEPGSAYVTTPLIGIGVVPRACSHSGSFLLDRTLAFDRAEAETANITQTNMIAVSSFNGVQGLLLGYDLLKQPLCPHPLLSLPDVEVLDAAPLFAATRALYGTVQQKRFPILPGQMLPCAAKTLYKNGPCLLYGALAVAIAERRERDADLFLEDLGTFGGTDEETDRDSSYGGVLPVRQSGWNETADAGQEAGILARLVDAVGRISDNLGVRYTKVFVGLRCRQVAAGEIGCVLAAVPYVRLARKAVPNDRPEVLAEYSLPQWEEAVRPHFLDQKPPPA